MTPKYLTVDTSFEGILARTRTRRRRARPRRSALPVGTDIDSGERVFLAGPARDEAGSMVVFGKTNTGKSTKIELYICNLLRLRQLCPEKAPAIFFMDPHRDAGERVLKRCREFGVPADQVILIDLGDPNCLPAWQPLALNGASVAFLAMTMASSIGKSTTGQQHFDQTQRLKTAFVATLWPLCEAGCGFPELAGMLSLDSDDPLRDAILRRCTNQAVRDFWEKEFKQLKTVAQKMDVAIGSCVNRLSSFFMQPQLRRLLGQTEGVIDWRAVMDDGMVVIVILDGGIQVADEDCRLAGILLLTDWVAAIRRPPARRGKRAVYISIDEFQRLINQLFLELLRECRKARAYGVLGTQDPYAVRAASEELYRAVLTNCATKVIFGGVSTLELEDICRDALAAVMNPDEVKFDLLRTYFEPHETTRLVHCISESDSLMVADGEGTTTAESWSNAAVTTASTGLVNSHAAGASHSAAYLDAGLLGVQATGFSTAGDSSAFVQALSQSNSVGRVAAQGGGTARTRSRTVAEGTSRARSVSCVPFHELHEKQELSSRQFRSCDEQLQRFVNAVHCLPPRHALVAQTGQAPQLIRVWDVPDPTVSDEEAAAYRQAIVARYRTPAQVDEAIAARQRALLSTFPPCEHTRVRRTSAAAAQGNGQAHELGNGKALSVDPAALLQAELSSLDLSNATELDGFLARLNQLSPKWQRPLLDRLAMESGRPKSFFSARLRTSRNGSATHGDH
jgi:hypothetical protein